MSKSWKSRKDRGMAPDWRRIKRHDKCNTWFWTGSFSYRRHCLDNWQSWTGSQEEPIPTYKVHFLILTGVSQSHNTNVLVCKKRTLMCPGEKWSLDSICNLSISLILFQNKSVKKLYKNVKTNWKKCKSHDRKSYVFNLKQGFKLY